MGPDGKPYQSQTPGTLGGNPRGKLYGRFDCRAALRATTKGGHVKYRVFFCRRTDRDRRRFPSLRGLPSGAGQSLESKPSGADSMSILRERQWFPFATKATRTKPNLKARSGVRGRIATVKLRSIFRSLKAMDMNANTEIRFTIGECSLGSVLVAQSERGVCAILLGDDSDQLRRDLQASFSRANLARLQRCPPCWISPRDIRSHLKSNIFR